MAATDEWASGELLENNQGVHKTDLMMESLKRKLEDEVDKHEETRTRNGAKDDEPSAKKMFVEQKCGECGFKCYKDGEMKTHYNTSHGGFKKLKLCGNCNFTCTNVWEMDFHCRSRGHKSKKDEGVPCKKCDYICANKDDVWVHKKVHIPVEKLVECKDCTWVGDRLDNIRYHCGASGHSMKEDYESVALAKAEAKGPKELAQYKKKLAKDLKKSKQGK